MVFENWLTLHHAKLRIIKRVFIYFLLQDDKVVEAVYSTGIHNVKHQDVEFSMAVHVHPYPSGVEAVWVYIGCLVRKGNQ